MNITRVMITLPSSLTGLNRFLWSKNSTFHKHSGFAIGITVDILVFRGIADDILVVFEGPDPVQRPFAMVIGMVCSHDTRSKFPQLIMRIESMTSKASSSCHCIA